MSENRKGREKGSIGERLLHSLFRIIQVVKIHQSNNRLFSDSVAEFHASLQSVWTSGRAAAFSLHRGRFFLNDERISYSPSMWATSVKMAEFFQQRGLLGLKFERPDELDDALIVEMVGLLNRAKAFPDPYEQLSRQMTGRLSWVKLSKETEQTVTVDEAAAEASDRGRTAVVRIDGADDLPKQARQTYSQALTILRTMVGRLGSGKKAGIQKAKRVVEELIDLSFEDEAIFLALSTVRDLDDQLFTHSVNVAVLSLALGKRLGLSRRVLENLGLAALFHDLGKAGEFVSAAGKSETLQGRDLAVVQSHTMGSVARIVRLNAGYALKFALLAPVCEHHLGVDLSGYPRSRRTKPPTLVGRILAVADRYDAMTSARPWRAEPLTPSEAIRALTSEAGRQLDPQLVKLFANLMGPYPVGSLLVLDDSRVALSLAGSFDPKRPYPVAVFLSSNEDGAVQRGAAVDLSDRDEQGVLKLRISSCLHPYVYGLQPVDHLL
jgi:HD-GYP domain-containing protein (c-di-GMP phosphodiesterase class II)